MVLARESRLLIAALTLMGLIMAPSGVWRVRVDSALSKPSAGTLRSSAAHVRCCSLSGSAIMHPPSLLGSSTNLQFPRCSTDAMTAKMASCTTAGSSQMVLHAVAACRDSASDTDDMCHYKGKCGILELQERT